MVPTSLKLAKLIITSLLTGSPIRCSSSVNHNFCSSSLSINSRDFRLFRDYLGKNGNFEKPVKRQHEPPPSASTWQFHSREAMQSKTAESKRLPICWLVFRRISRDKLLLPRDLTFLLLLGAARVLLTDQGMRVILTWNYCDYFSIFFSYICFWVFHKLFMDHKLWFILFRTSLRKMYIILRPTFSRSSITEAVIFSFQYFIKIFRFSSPQFGPPTVWTKRKRAKRVRFELFWRKRERKRLLWWVRDFNAQVLQ